MCLLRNSKQLAGQHFGNLHHKFIIAKYALTPVMSPLRFYYLDHSIIRTR